MTVGKVIAKIIWLTFFGPPCIFREHKITIHTMYKAITGMLSN